jgi:hypothetical protein
LTEGLGPLRAALDGLAFAAYEAGANGETMLGDCDDVAEWIEEAMSRAAEAVAAERERFVRIVESYRVPVGNSAAGELAAQWTMDALREILVDAVASLRAGRGQGE